MKPERSADGELEYRQLDLADSGRSVLKLFNEAFSAERTWDEFEWKYLQPPFRRLDVFGAIHIASGELAGAFACGLREYWRAGELVIGFQEADAAVDARHRGKGIFPSLLGYMTDFVRHEGGLFHYGFTNELSAAAMKKVGGNSENYSNRVFALPLGATNVVRTVGLDGPIGSIARRLGGPIIRLVSTANIRKLRSELTLETASDIDDLPDIWARKWSNTYPLVPRRTERYLKWRVFEAPVAHLPNLRLHWILRNGTRVGYVVSYLEKRRNALKIIDLLCDPDEVELWQCLGATLPLAFELGVDAVSTNVAGEAHHRAFQRCGFIALANARCNIFSVSPDFSVERHLGSPTWYLAPIDRDTFGDY